MESNDNRTFRKIWSKSEKEMLLHILKTDGHTNLNRIAAAIPNKSIGAIKSVINKYIVRARSLKPNIADPLDFWIHSYYSPENEDLISKALMFIRLFEDHPTPEEINGVDIKLIYEFLHRSTLGHGPGEIPPETLKAIENELTLISNNLTTVSEKEVFMYLSTLITRQKPARDYSRKNRDKTC